MTDQLDQAAASFDTTRRLCACGDLELDDDLEPVVVGLVAHGRVACLR